MSVSWVTIVYSEGWRSLIAVRCPGIIDKTADISKLRLRRFHKTLPIALFGDICLVKSHAFWHRLHCTLATIFIDVSYYYLCSLFRK